MAGTTDVWELFLKHHALRQPLSSNESGHEQKLPSIFDAIKYTEEELMYIERSRSHMSWLFGHQLDNAQSRCNTRLHLQHCSEDGLHIAVSTMRATKPLVELKNFCWTDVGDESIVLHFTTTAFIHMLNDYDKLDEKLHKWQAAYGKLFDKYRTFAQDKEALKKAIDGCLTRLDDAKKAEDALLSVRMQLGESHAKHKADALRILEWQETCTNLEQLCRQLDNETEYLRALVGNLLKQQAMLKIQSAIPKSPSPQLRDPQQPQTPEARHPSYTGRLTRPSRQPSTSMNTRQPSCGRRDWNDEKRGKTPASCPEKRLVKAQEPILPNVRTHTSVRDPSPSLGWAHSLKQKTSIASHRVRLMKAKAKQLPTWA